MRGSKRLVGVKRFLPPYGYPVKDGGFMEAYTRAQKYVCVCVWTGEGHVEDLGSCRGILLSAASVLMGSHYSLLEPVHHNKHQAVTRSGIPGL